MSGSVGGLPECRNCRRVFTRVEGLKKHLKSGCPAKPATEAGPETAAGLSGEVPDTQVELPRGWAPQAVSVAAVSSEAKPAPITGLMQRPEFVALVQRDWKTVLRHPTHVAVPKEHCVLCGQWCAAIQQHMHLMHPNVWHLKTDAEDRCHSLLLPADSPCKYCEQTHQQPRLQASLAGLVANPPTQVPDDGDGGGRPVAAGPRGSSGDLGRKGRKEDRPNGGGRQQGGRGLGPENKIPPRRPKGQGIPGPRGNARRSAPGSSRANRRRPQRQRWTLPLRNSSSAW